MQTSHQNPKKIEFSKEIIRFQNEKTFEKIMQLTPLEIETVMNLDPEFKLPLDIDFVIFSFFSVSIKPKTIFNKKSHLKDQISAQEKALKQAVLSVMN